MRWPEVLRAVGTGRSGGVPRHAAPVALGALAAYSVVQNTAFTRRAYVPANLVATAGMVALARRAGSSWSDLGLDSEAIRPGMRLGAQIGVGATAVLSSALAATPTRQVLLDGRAHGLTPATAAYQVLVRSPVGTALFEEIAFRGVLESLWRSRSGPKTARIVSAAAFGAWHLLPTYRLYPEMGVGSATPRRSARILAALGGAVVTGIAGMSFSWLRNRRDSIAAPWLAHASYNSAAYLAAWLAWRLEQPAKPTS